MKPKVIQLKNRLHFFKHFNHQISVVTLSQEELGKYFLSHSREENGRGVGGDIVVPYSFFSDTNQFLQKAAQLDNFELSSGNLLGVLAKCGCLCMALDFLVHRIFRKAEKVKI